MSELKEHQFCRYDEIVHEYSGDFPNDLRLYYLKSEADKVIAEKDKEIAELQKQVHDYAQGLYVIQARAEKEIRHQKRKRCLAMALFCFTKGKEKLCVYKLRTFFWSRCGNRWLKLAEKFKEAK